MREHELEVLSQYDIEIKSTRKIRGAFFCDTNRGNVLLKEVHFSEKRAPLLVLLCRQLESRGYPDVDMPILTKEGDCLASGRDGRKYLLKRWFSGRECDVKKEQDLLAAVRNLARLHLLMYWEAQEEPPAQGRDLREEYFRHCREMKKVRAFIRAKRNKGEFELLYLKHFEGMYRLADSVKNRLADSSYEQLLQKSLAEKRLVHGDYNYHNILFPGNQPVTVNFDSFRPDVQMADLYYFLRKVMEKHRWRRERGEKLLRAYSSIRPLSDAEQEYLALRFCYPEKFWKIANAYYHSNKAWIPEKSVEKLKICVEQTGERKQFAEQILSFHL